MSGRLKGWGRVATRRGRWPMAFLSAIALAAIVTNWLWVLILGAQARTALNWAIQVFLRIFRSCVPAITASRVSRTSITLDH